MKKILLVICVIIALGLIGLKLRSNHNSPPRILARANAALESGQFSRAIKLSDEYVQRHPGKSRGYVILGLANSHLGNFQTARKILTQALEIKPDDPSAVIALSQTYTIEAAQCAELNEQDRQLNIFEQCIKSIRRANEILISAKVKTKSHELRLRQIIGSNEIRLSRLYDKKATKLRYYSKIAEAGDTSQRVKEILEYYEGAKAQAQSLKKDALDKLCGVIEDYKKLEVSEQKHPLTIKHVDFAAQDAVRLCADMKNQSAWSRIKTALSGMDEVSPVAVAQLQIFEMQSETYDSFKQQRESAQKAIAKINSTLKNARSPAEQKKLTLIKAALAMIQEEYAQVEQLCFSVIEETPRDPAARLLRARALIAMKRFEEAEKLLFVLKTDVPQDPEIVFAYAQASHATGKLSLAQEAILTVIELAPEYGPARKYLIEKYLREDYLEQAFDQAYEYFSHNPDDPVALKLFVRATHITERDNQAIQAIDESVERYPNQPEILATAAESLRILGNDDRSIELAIKASQIKAENTTDRLGIVKALSILEKSDMAEVLLTEELRKFPNLLVVQHEAAEFFAESGNNSRAIKHYRRAIELDPVNFEYRISLARLLLKQGQLNECEDILNTFPEDYPIAEKIRAELRVLRGEPARNLQVMAQ